MNMNSTISASPIDHEEYCRASLSGQDGYSEENLTARSTVDEGPSGTNSGASPVVKPAVTIPSHSA